jgi:hypothetical protein
MSAKCLVKFKHQQIGRRYTPLDQGTGERPGATAKLNDTFAL